MNAMNPILDAAERLKALGSCGFREARDPVNQPMINNWTEVMGGPAWDDGVAPPAMIQVWTMRGLHPSASLPEDPLWAMSAVLDEAGYTSVVATNSEQTYHRYVKLGERLTVRSRLSDVVGPKRTALGEGWFVTTESVWYSGDEPVATMMFRILKYRPAPRQVLRPVVTDDNAFFWEGTGSGELRIQKCLQCGRLRHPPGPMCPACGSGSLSYAVAKGEGTVFSYVVHHHPAVPGRELPFIVVLVELTEGVRMVGSFDGGQASIGQPVRVRFQRIDETLTMPVWEAA
ncbi:MAG TPA: OB-fold domain-containing protein [Candidatus Limnocylindrales bacterium]|nr:OB-fold domain-containing protein [Candidatus Limnocylindrales bacterium]